MNAVEMSPDLLKQVVNPWLIGADPEFAVLEPPDKLVANAGEYATNVENNSGSIGNDHGGRVWEVRPAPSPSSYGVVTNIWKLLRSSSLSKVERFKWKGGALGARKNPPANGNVSLTQQQVGQLLQQQQAQMLQQAQMFGGTPGTITFTGGNAAAPEPTPIYDTLGGHVHFGLYGFSGPQKAVLDKLTTAMLNLDVLPRKENTTRMSYGAYGRFNVDAVRECDGHVEYRCAPSWLDKPGQAFAVLTAYKLACARPSSVNWTGGTALKTSFLEWLTAAAKIDVDAFLLDRFIEKRGFGAIQADPETDFRPLWRKEELWKQA